jgi:hypothetical protein
MITLKAAGKWIFPAALFFIYFQADLNPLLIAYQSLLVEKELIAFVFVIMAISISVINR